MMTNQLIILSTLMFCLLGCEGTDSDPMTLVDGGVDTVDANQTDTGFTDLGVEADLGEGADAQVEADVGTEVDAAEEALVSFTQDVLPIISARCTRCHNDGPGTFDLRGDNAAHNLFNWRPTKQCVPEGQLFSIPVIDPGSPETSLLWLKISDADRPAACGKKMPTDGALIARDPAAAETIRLWILQGAELD